MGDVICGRWELIAPIAVGGSSTVWHAVDRRLGIPCAAKLLRQRDAGQLLRFAREQAIRIDHPHVVAPYAWGADDGTVVIAFELVTGGSLADLVGDYGPLGEGTVTTVLDQLLAALEAVHGAGIVHRDVKPANVLLRATGGAEPDVALIDFGIALTREDARLTHLGAVVGTPGYVPPEVLLGAGAVGPAHDLYALGRLALTLLSGDEDAPRPAVEDAALDRALSAMTAADPRERAATVDEVRGLLASAGRDRLPRDRDGEPIEVLDHLAAASDADTHAPAPTVVVMPEPPARDLRDPRDPRDPRDAGRPRRPPRRRGPWIAAAATALVAGLAWWAALQLPALAPQPPARTPSPSVTAPDTECTWLDEGDTVSGPDGALTCIRTDDGYRWTPARR